MKEALRIIANLDSFVEQDIYCSKFADELAVRKDAVVEDLNRIKSSKRRDYAQKEYKKISAELTGRDEKLNLQRRENVRAAKAEEMLISYIFHNPDMYQRASQLVSPSDFVTDFNARFYSYITEKIREGIQPDLNISQDFTPEEVSRFYSIINSYNSQAATLSAMQEYIDTIHFEKNKLSKADLSDMSPEEIMQKLKNSRKPKN